MICLNRLTVEKNAISPDADLDPADCRIRWGEGEAEKLTETILRNQTLTNSYLDRLRHRWKLPLMRPKRCRTKSQRIRRPPEPESSSSRCLQLLMLRRCTGPQFAEPIAEATGVPDTRSTDRSLITGYAVTDMAATPVLPRNPSRKTK